MQGSWPAPTPLGVPGTSQEVKPQHRVLLWGTAGSGGAGTSPPHPPQTQQAADSQDNLVLVAAAQLLVRKDDGVENNDLGGDGDAAACGESARG